jgi:hypothetical protein
VNAMVDKYPHKLQFNDAGREPFDRIAALMDFDDWKNAIVYSGDIISQCAEQIVKGNTEIICTTPEFDQLYQNNKEFFKALCEDGVVEWLTPLVLAKSSTPPHDHLAPPSLV